MKHPKTMKCLFDLFWETNPKLTTGASTVDSVPAVTRSDELVPSLPRRMDRNRKLDWKKSGKWSIWDHHRLRLNLKGPIQRHTYLNESVLGGKTPSVVNLCHKPFPTLPEVLQYAPSQKWEIGAGSFDFVVQPVQPVPLNEHCKGHCTWFPAGPRSHQVSPGETVCWTARLPRQLWRLHTWPSRSVNDEPMAVRLWFHQIFTIDFSCQAIKNQLHINIWDAS